MSEALDALGTRIAALMPAEGLEIPWSLDRAVAPLLRALGWRPTFSTRAIETLIELHPFGASDGLAHEPLLRATEELAENVSQLERAAAVDGSVPTAHAAWLWRSHQLLRAIERTLEAGDDEARFGPATALSVLPPLTAREPKSGTEVHLDSIDPLLRAATDEMELLGRRRRLLEAARELLLDTSAALDLDAEGVARRQQFVASEIARLDRLQAAGVAPDVAVVYQAGQALRRGDAGRLHAVLAAVETMGERRGGGRMSTLSRRALGLLWGGEPRFDETRAAASLARSGAEVLSPGVAAAVSRGYQLGRDRLRADMLGPDEKKAGHAASALRRLPDEIDEETLFAALRVDGCFDVGGAASPVRVVEEDRRLRAVRFPSQDLVLVPAREPSDIGTAVIEDPRRILLDLATGRLLSRRYVVEEVRHRERGALRREVRVYVLDGSGSMLGPRARMRDGILVAELSTLIARYQDPGRNLDPRLYFRYFNEQVGPTTRVDSAEGALAAIEEALATVRHGGTDIEGALLASFDQIREAKATDPDLATAQIVLVTDGEAEVSLERVLVARESIGSLPVGVSIIALGEENPALRRLAAHQRRAGERVFYQFMPDADLRATVDGRNAGLPIHLPFDVELGDLRGELEAILDDMEAATRPSPRTADEDAELRLSAFDEVELSWDHAARDAERAKVEAARRDLEAVQRRFDRWFPEPEGAAAPRPRMDADSPDVDVVVALLLSTAEVVELVGDAGPKRRIDAIELFERLLLDAGITPWRYATLLRRRGGDLAAGTRAVRDASRDE